MVTNIMHFWRYAQPTGTINRILNSVDDSVLDEIILTQQKSKTGIYKSTPSVLTPREMQEVGTKLGYKDFRRSKIESLQAKYPTVTKTLNFDGAETEFTIFKGSRGGSNKGFWATIKGSEDLYYIKFGDEAHIRSEKLAGELYELGGVPSTHKKIVSYTIPPKNKWSDPTIKVGVATKFMPINALPDPTDIKTVQEGFGLDCWLANWDALKDGNVVMSAGNAARLDVGGSLCYRARGKRKGAAFNENVGELTSFFENYSHSRPYIKNMTKEDLLSSLDRVTSIPDEKVIETINKAAEYKTLPGGIDPKTGQYSYSRYHTEARGIQNPEYLKETLLARKKYILNFKTKCQETPQLEGETIEAYIRRIDKLIEKKSYNLPFDEIEMSSEITGIKGLTMAERLTPQQKKIYEDSFIAYMKTKHNRLITAPANDILTPDTMIHSGSPKNLSKILDDGITSGDLRGNIGSGTGCETQTQLCADFWDIQQPISIKDYFRRSVYNPGEANFLPKLSGVGVSRPHAMIFVVDKKKVAPTIMKNSFRVSENHFGSILYKDGNMAGHNNYITHRAVPIGVPAGAIDRIIIQKSAYSGEAIQQIKDMIAKRGLNIQLYDLDGNLI